MSAELLDVLVSSRKDGAHLRGVTIEVRDMGEDISGRGGGECVRGRGFFRSHYHHRMGEITVLYFAAATTTTGRTSETFALPDDGLTLPDLAKLIVSRHPKTGIDRVLEQSRWIVDKELIYLTDSFVLRGGEEVVVLPPVSGG